MIQCIIFKFRKWHTCNFEWYRLYRSYENCRRPGVAILDMQISKVPIISGYVWFLRRRFLCEFPLGSYVKLSSAVGAILVEGPNRRTHFWKRTIQWLSHQNFVLIEQMVSDKIFMGISHSYVKLSSAVVTILVGVLKCRTQFWKKDHPRIISAKFGWDWLSSFRGEDFF